LELYQLKPYTHSEYILSIVYLAEISIHFVKKV